MSKPSTYNIRMAVEQDALALVDLEIACFQTDRLDQNQIRRFIRKPTAIVTVIEDEMHLIGGAILLLRKGSNMARLYSIAIQPDKQGHGMGAILLKHIEQLARELPRKEIRLEVRDDMPHIRRFYQQQGYQAFGYYDAFYDDGCRAVRMRKVIA